VTRADIPNLISLLRIVLVLPTIMALASGQYVLALILFTIAGISDGLDGYIAKHYHYESRLGTLLDPIADKLLLVATYVVLALKGLLPVWLMVAVIGRDVLIVAGAALYYWLVGAYEMAPTLISKFNTLTQILLGLLVVFSHGIHPLPAQLIDGLVFLVLATTLASGADYVWTWGARAFRARSSR
jgi:cardiolipin synthase